MKKVTLLTIAAIIILGIYVLPSVTARLAGSHTWELNASGGPSALQCGKCHVYIKSEFNATGTGLTNVVSQHMAASANPAYINNTNEGGIINASTPSSASMDTVCAMCHVTETSGYQGHTRVTIRACTDGDCHGKSTDATYSHLFKNNLYTGGELNVTEKLKLDVDAHSRFYVPLNNSATASQYVQEGDADSGDSVKGGNYTLGFYACLGCHTHVGVQMDVKRPNIINFSITNTDGLNFVVSAININTTSFNTTTSYGTTGSKWN